jgi:hypothetical protein
MTTDFRCLYATMIEESLGLADTMAILKGRFEPLGAFAWIQLHTFTSSNRAAHASRLARP